MKKYSWFFISGVAILVITVLGTNVQTSWASSVTNLLGGSIITNSSADNALTIRQNSDVGKSRSNSGAFLLDNSGNRNTGLTLYSNMSDEVRQPLMRMEVTNPSWDEEVLYIHSESPTSRGLIRLDSPAPEIEFVETDQSDAAGKFEMRVQHDTLQFNSRRSDDSTFEKKVVMTHEGDLLLHAGTLKVEGTDPAEFAGGINLTGGCLAIDGDCVDLGDLPVTKTDTVDSDDEDESKQSAAMTVLRDGVPEALACNSYTEQGSMVLAAEENRLYVCNGPDRGWDYTTLSD